MSVVDENIEIYVNLDEEAQAAQANNGLIFDTYFDHLLRAIEIPLVQFLEQLHNDAVVTAAGKPRIVPREFQQVLRHFVRERPEATRNTLLEHLRGGKHSLEHLGTNLLFTLRTLVQSLAAGDQELVQLVRATRDAPRFHVRDPMTTTQLFVGVAAEAARIVDSEPTLFSRRVKSAVFRDNRCKIRDIVKRALRSAINDVAITAHASLRRHVAEQTLRRVDSDAVMSQMQRASNDAAGQPQLTRPPQQPTQSTAQNNPFGIPMQMPGSTFGTAMQSPQQPFLKHPASPYASANADDRAAADSHATALSAVGANVDMNAPLQLMSAGQNGDQASLDERHHNAQQHTTTSSGTTHDAVLAHGTSPLHNVDVDLSASPMTPDAVRDVNETIAKALRDSTNQNYEAEQANLRQPPLQRAPVAPVANAATKQHHVVLATESSRTSPSIMSAVRPQAPADGGRDTQDQFSADDNASVDDQQTLSHALFGDADDQSASSLASRAEQLAQKYYHAVEKKQRNVESGRRRETKALDHSAVKSADIFD